MAAATTAPRSLTGDCSWNVRARIRTDVDVGAWHVTADGRYCRTWNVWDNGRTRCYTVYRDGEAFELHPEDRLSKFVLTRRTGNPEHY